MFEDGNAVLQKCSQRTQPGRFICDGYVEGVADLVIANAGRTLGTRICFPTDSPTSGQLADLVVTWLEDNPVDENGLPRQSLYRPFEQVFLVYEGFRLAHLVHEVIESG